MTRPAAPRTGQTSRSKRRWRDVHAAPAPLRSQAGPCFRCRRKGMRAGAARRLGNGQPPYNPVTASPISSPTSVPASVCLRMTRRCERSADLPAIGRRVTRHPLCPGRGRQSGCVASFAPLCKLGAAARRARLMPAPSPLRRLPHCRAWVPAELRPAPAAYLGWRERQRSAAPPLPRPGFPAYASCAPRTSRQLESSCRRRT